MVIAMDDCNIGPATDATRCRQVLSAVSAISALILQRTKLAAMGRARSPSAPVVDANFAAGASI